MSRVAVSANLAFLTESYCDEKWRFVVVHVYELERMKRGEEECTSPFPDDEPIYACFENTVHTLYIYSKMFSVVIQVVE